jgi:pyridoxine 5-phosphate synthase
MDAGSTGLELAAAMGVERVEIYTGPFAEAHARGEAASALAQCARTARDAQALGLGVNAGHDLSQANLADFLRGVPGVLEVSIGHALFGEALHDGLAPTVRAYLDIIRSARSDG